MLSPSEAASFLKNVLKFENWKDVLDRDKREFLKTLVPYYLHNLAFHNTSMTSIPPEKRNVPTAEEIVADGLSGIGGACITQNTFVKILLESLGFNAYLVAGRVHGPGIDPDHHNHVLCVVELSPDEKYLFDTGVGLPISEPIPLHSLPYYNKGAGVRYCYKKADDREGVYYRVQLDGALYGAEYKESEKEFVRYEFSLTPQKLEIFTKPLSRTFQDVDYSIFLQHPFMFRYFEEDADGQLLESPNVTGDRKWILIRGVSVLIATDNNKTQTHYSSYDEVIPIILKYFPQFSKENIEKSLKHWNDTVEKHGHFRAKVIMPT